MTPGGLAQRRPRVVFVDHVARLSGAELALSRLLPTLSEQVDVHVVLGEEGPLVERLESLGVPVEVIPLAPALRDIRRDAVRPGRLRARDLTALPASVLALRRRLRELRADVVHTNSLKAALYGGVAGRLARIPVVWHVRDRIAVDYLPPPAVGLVRAASRVLPSAVVANSWETLGTLPRRDNAHVVYNAVEAPPGEPDSRPPADGRAPTIGVVGRLADWKGQDVFLRAFAQAFAGGRARARLVGGALFGEDEYERSLRVLVEELGISEQVDFRGFREDVWAELRELDVLVHCSVRPEPFGQVVLEGLAAGVPVVASRAGGPAEVITHGIDGMLTTPGDAAELAGTLRTLVADASLRRRLSAAGRERSREFTPERAVSQLVSIYDGLLRRAGRL